MRRFIVIVVLAAGVIGVWWLAEDSQLRHRLGELGDEIVERTSGKPPPSWGDVAERVGEFAKEERGLKQTVGRLGANATDDDPQPTAAEPVAD